MPIWGRNAVCRRIVGLAAVILGLGGALSASPASAQDWRDMSAFRQRSGEERLDVSLRYGAGRLSIEPGTGTELYRFGLRYDSDLFQPIARYRPGRLEVGVEGTGRNLRLKNQQPGELRLALSPGVPLDLDLEFGAVEASLELGGLQVRSIHVRTGASDSKVRFSQPNAAACERFRIEMGAAAFEAIGLGNAGCRRIQVDGGVGDLRLEFGGDWSRDMDAAITMALGSVMLAVPDEIGVRVDKAAFLTDFARNGFEKRGDVYYSRNWERADRRLAVELRGAFGSVNVRWTGPAAVTP